jgi:hypothetical protein
MQTAPVDVPALINSLPDYIAAISALGASATGLVDTTKLFNGGISRAGFGIIKKRLEPFDKILGALPEASGWHTIFANWVNGVDLDAQKSTVKAMIKLCLNEGNAVDMAKAIGMTSELDKTNIKALATAYDTGAAPGDALTNVYGRMDGILSAILDAAYEEADQRYRNAAKFWAACIAVGLSILGSLAVYDWKSYTPSDFFQAVFVGLVATPLAPVAKDLTTAINTAVQSSGQLRALLK